MSGYLQRLVGRVQSPAAGIRPRVRPLFAPAAEGLSETTAEFTATAAPPPARNVSHARSAPAAPAVDSPVHTLPRVERAVDRGESGESRLTIPVLTPLLAPMIPQSAESAPRSEEVPGAVAPESATLVGATVPMVHAVREQREARVQQLLPSVAAPVRANAAAAPAPPDEIQIHIGRIEITAVPPAPVARAAPPRTQRAVNLDEYLKRSRGSRQ